MLVTEIILTGEKTRLGSSSPPSIQLKEPNGY